MGGELVGVIARDDARPERDEGAASVPLPVGLLVRIEPVAARGTGISACSSSSLWAPDPEPVS